jgi:protein-L-isoaspartate(D-aspartate) O-methyltransferase
LGWLVREVHAIELVPELAQRARGNLAEAGISNVTVHTGDGSLGLPEHAPYDAILVAAAAPRIPAALVEQLADGGRLILPVAARWSDMLKRIRKRGDRVLEENLCGCRFVPLIMS